MRKQPAVKIPMLDWQRDYLADDSKLKWLVASRQSGKSHGGALEDVIGAVAGDPLSVILSAGERQALEVMRKVQMNTRALGAALDGDVVDSFWKDTSLLQHTATFPNKSRIICLPANPDTARGWSGNVRLDEFGVIENSRDIWAALYPTITRGYKLRVTSTFKGTANKFYELGKMLGLVDGVRPEAQPAHANGWSGRWVDIYMVAEQARRCPELGLKIDPDELRRGLDDDEIWLQEFCNIPMEGGESYVPLALVLACESELASLTWDGRPRPGLCAGWDFGRKRDRSVIVIGQLVAGLLIVVGAIWLDRLPFAEQEKMGRQVAQAIQDSDGRFCMDAGGNGAQIAETLQGEFTCVDAVQFASTVETGAKTEEGDKIKELVKLRIARDAKRRFEEQAFRLPESAKIRNGVTAVKRGVSPTGAILLAAAHSSQGHGDEFWALALLNAAVSEGRHVYVPASECGLVGKPVMADIWVKEF